MEIFNFCKGTCRDRVILTGDQVYLLENIKSSMEFSKQEYWSRLPFHTPIKSSGMVNRNTL